MRGGGVSREGVAWIKDVLLGSEGFWVIVG